ncbi:phosphonoacetaldehyde hydrolase [Bacillus wudalianchiensis]|uniref:Phosphonoacetaldehyde hydrolase n=1 Tax=Pseudobacillus wudalianchiensis TaxID=1743143 RepID=A0A1B9AZC3_9BACI|nr:phosphonoacetaldehyde hydrolase [Bacillus wudalianchiensis]
MIPLNRCTHRVEAVIFDWAGTMVDYGCLAPLEVFKAIFKKRGINVLDEEAREPMGLQKLEHIREMCSMPRISRLWRDMYGREPEERDINALYADFEPMLFSILPAYSNPIPGAVELVERLRNAGIKIGSTTGYTSEMIAIVKQEAKKKGYAPDSLVTSSQVPAGRPFPWMFYQNAINLEVYPMNRMVKVGDTVSDIKEGLNAGAWSVGVIKGSSELGLTKEEVQTMDPALLAEKMKAVAETFTEAGAHYVIESIGELDELLPKINRRLANDEPSLLRGF